ncbi:MAG: hypothetical protein FWF03_01095 [Defluviitaleaceae bacterium]|nr:hypothetical protein [Defluviitaleaceae bacterium]
MTKGNSRVDKLHIYVCLIAAFTVTVVCIIKQETIFKLAGWVILTVAAFYVIGSVARFFITTNVFPKPPEDAPSEEGSGAEAEAPQGDESDAEAEEEDLGTL